MLRMYSLVFATCMFAFAFDADARRQDAHHNMQGLIKELARVPCRPLGLLQC